MTITNGQCNMMTRTYWSSASTFLILLTVSSLIFSVTHCQSGRNVSSSFIQIPPPRGAPASFSSSSPSTSTSSSSASSSSHLNVQPRRSASRSVPSFNSAPPNSPIHSLIHVRIPSSSASSSSRPPLRSRSATLTVSNGSSPSSTLTPASPALITTPPAPSSSSIATLIVDPTTGSTGTSTSTPSTTVSTVDGSIVKNVPSIEATTTINNDEGSNIDTASPSLANVSSSSHFEMSGESLMENESNEKRGFTSSPPTVRSVVASGGTSMSSGGGGVALNHGIFLNQQPHHANGPGPGQLLGESSDRFLRAEMQRYDGWYNNLAHPDWGSLESQLTRKTPPSYSDGVYMMAGADRPSPRFLSQVVMKGEDGLPSSRNLTTIFAFFGQMVSSEILMASESGCPIEMHKIEIAKCDDMYDRECKGGRKMPFHRAQYDSTTGQSPNLPREQLNRVTSWIDGSFVYSTSETWVNTMRTFQNGTFKTEISAKGSYPIRNKDRVPLINAPPAHQLKMVTPERMFLLGDPRTNQNPAILALGILLFRWHNELAARVQAEYPSWSDEDVFQRARRLVIASMQNIILYEYLPILLGPDDEIAPYSGYKPDVHPGISHVFQSAAFRFGHTMIPPGLYRRDAKCNFKHSPSGYTGIRLCSTWWDAQDTVSNFGLEELLMGLASQIAEREDSVLCSDVRDKLFGPIDFSRRDLAALNIMRGRDNGLPDYNTVRRAFGMKPITRWPDINPVLYKAKPQIFAKLEEAYKGNINNIDLYVGGMLETNPNEGRPGPLFRRIIKEQFERIRDSDRFWFENEAAGGVFTKEEIEAIRKIKLWDLIVNVSDIPVEAIQKDVFRFNPGDPCPQPTQLNSSLLEPCSILPGWDYFTGSEIPYIMVCLLLLTIPGVVAMLGFGVIRLQSRRKRLMKAKKEVTTGKKDYDKQYVREWLHANYKRYVKVKIGPDETISTINRKGEILRKLDYRSFSTVTVEITQDARKPMILIRSPKDHDLVLQFDNNSSRKKFLTKLESFLLNHKKTLEIIHTYRDVMLEYAETKEKRQKRLDRFFREAYALTFGIPSNESGGNSGKKGSKHNNNNNGGYSDELSSDVIMVMRTSLSKNEFAEALGMKPDSLFVKQMFNCVDKDKNGRISFQEFLDTVVMFSRGKTEDKLKVIFDMCEDRGDGLIDKEELVRMLRSLVDIAKTNSLDENSVMNLIDGMFESVGLQDKKQLTWDDFKNMMKGHKSDLIAIGLDLKGANLNYLDTSSNVARMTSFQINQLPEQPKWFLSKKWAKIVTYLEENRQHIVYLLIFYVTTGVLFFERFFNYSYFSEHTDLRHVMGYGIAVTRGSAASLSFCYSLLLLTMCRNLITKIRECSLHQYIPLDSHVQFHKIVAMTALFFTLIHTIGHCINFYHVSTQPLDHLRCLIKEMSFDSDNKPTFTFWIFGTVTGITGVLLWALVMVIFIFAHPKIRRKAYYYFWNAHNLYPLLYILSLLHGLAKLTGTPRFWIFMFVPAILFIIDKIISLQTRYMELDILETELLPSDVTKVKFSRPPNFKYLSGQWVRLCCTGLRSNEYHSFTLTSAPHENYLSVHVKAQGPWTWKLRNYLDPNNLTPDHVVPKIKLEGPFGGGNQDWYKYEIAIMVGGGIGVTPYASILNDLVFGTSTNRYSGVACKKVYFLWICQSHKHFEWFIDVLRDVERKDVTNVLEIHIFITKFFHKFDLRTTMLYICENHFQRISNRSMFTGLKAVNHFGRPDMVAFLKYIQRQHSYVSKIGVFSCGPSNLTKTISHACESVNTARRLPYFIHQFENF